MKNKKQKAFTLIELLVVIAIIGLLSAIVLAALGSARAKSKDKAIVSELASIRSQAEIYYTYSSTNGAPGNYGVRGTPGTNGLDPSCSLNDISGSTTFFGADVATKGSALTLLNSIKDKAGAGTGQTACGASPRVANAPITSWAVAARLTENGAASDYWCVDSSGVSRLVPASPTVLNAGDAINSLAQTTSCK